MKLNSFKFQDGKVFWLPEYPEEPDYIQPGDTNSYAVMTDMNYPLQKEYNEAVAKSLVSAIEVAPEDVEEIRLMVVKNIYRDGLGQGVKITSMTQPLPGKVYSAECEMGIEKQCKGTDGKTDWKQTEFERWQCEPDWVFRQVARLKPKDEIFPAANSHDMKDDDL